MKTITNLDDYLDFFAAENPYQAGRALYKNISCGPWTVFVIKKSKKSAETLDIYYESERANSNLKNCIGVKIGSIVEGSDGEITPFALTFPFTEKQLNYSLQQMNDEAISLWEESNETP